MMKQIVMFAWLMAMSLGSVKAQDVKVEFFTPSIVHVVKGEPTKTLVITAKPEHVAVTHTGDTWKSSELTVKLEPETETLVFMTNRGKVLLRERGISMVRKTEHEFEVSQSFFLDRDEAIYGLGTIQNGKMNRRGEKKRMEQSNLEDFQNVLQSIKGWGLYWENYSPTVFEDNAEGMSFTSEAGQGIDYYFMYGGSADGVIARMRHLTGDVPMFPLWTYGYWQSKERYKTAAETEGIVDRYRALQVPLDGIIQDWQYWGSNYLWNAMDFLSEDFATGPQLIKNVHAKHAHFMISIWASFGPQTQQFRELNEKGLLLPFETWPQSGISHIWPPVMKYPSGVKVYDAFSPEARAIYWKYLKTLYDYGCDAWWMDSTDPDFFNPRESDYAHKVYGGTWRSQRNSQQPKAYLHHDALVVCRSAALRLEHVERRRELVVGYAAQTGACRTKFLADGQSQFQYRHRWILLWFLQYPGPSLGAEESSVPGVVCALDAVRAVLSRVPQSWCRCAS